MTTSSRYSLADYTRALSQLLPRGLVWPKSSDSVQGQAIAGFAEIFQSTDQAAQQLLVEAFPINAGTMLPEWEETFGLPDPCLGGSPTTLERQASVNARFEAVPADTVAYLLSYAASLGYSSITITKNAPFRMGISGMGDPIGEDNWYYVLTVTGTYDAALECELVSIVPAEVVLLFE